MTTLSNEGGDLFFIFKLGFIMLRRDQDKESAKNLHNSSIKLCYPTEN